MRGSNERFSAEANRSGARPANARAALRPKRPAWAPQLHRVAAALAGRLVRVPRIVPYFALSVPPRARRPLAVALLALAILSGAYVLWFRDSSLVAIDEVEVSGLTSRDAPRVRAALESAARDMTTLHLSRERLQAAVSPWPVVHDLRVVADFPKAVRIEAVERRPVALVGSGDDRVPVAADGTVLRGLPGTPRLPGVDQRGQPGGDRLGVGATLTLVEVAGAAPPTLLARLETVRRSERGLVVEMRRGPDVVLGSPARLAAKWAAAGAVLADRTSRGAAYVDVRLPDRAVAGGLPEPAAQPEDPSPGPVARSPEPSAPPPPAPISPPSPAVTPQAQP